MKKSMLALAVAGALASPMVAQAGGCAVSAWAGGYALNDKGESWKGAGKRKKAKV